MQQVLIDIGVGSKFCIYEQSDILLSGKDIRLHLPISLALLKFVLRGDASDSSLTIFVEYLLPVARRTICAAYLTFSALRA
jgi:hypothetical protein